MKRSVRPGRTGAARIGSALVGVAILLRADVPAEPPIQPRLSFEPPPRGGAVQRLALPVPHFGDEEPVEPAIARVLAAREKPSPKARALASASSDAIGRVIEAAPPPSVVHPAQVVAIAQPQDIPPVLASPSVQTGPAVEAAVPASPDPRWLSVAGSRAEPSAAAVPANDIAPSATLPQPVFGPPMVTGQEVAPPPPSTSSQPQLTVVPTGTAAPVVLPVHEESAEPEPEPVKVARRLVPVRNVEVAKGGIPVAITAPTTAASEAADYFRQGPRSDAGAGVPQFGPDDELVLEIRTADGQQGDTVIAYGTRAGVYLPLGAIARFLDLAVSVSDDGHFASGWFLNEKRTLNIDLRQRVLEVAGKPTSFTPGDAVAFEGELYLRDDHFAQIFPLLLKTNLREQSITIKTLEPFPFEERLARERDRARLSQRGGGQAPQKWPRQETPWQALSVPLADLEVRAVADRTMGRRVEGDLRLAGDLAFMTAQAFLGTSSRDGITGARLSLGRQDPDADLAGPLKATEFQIGDVSSSALPIGLRGTSGRGVFITNSPVVSVSVFDKVDLRGALPDGYEVELYRNNMLIASTRQANNGQYEFLQVPVDFGMNVFRFVFYGPQGQRREDVRRISVGDGRIAPGKLVYSAAMVQKDVNLFDVRGPNFAPSQDFASWRYTGQLSYGLTQGITASVGGAWFDSDSGRHWQVNAGLRTSIAGVATSIDVATQDRGGRAASMGLGGTIAGIGFRAVHAEYRGAFTDEVRAYSSDPLRQATEVDFSASLKLGGGPAPFSIPLSVRYRRLERLDGREETDAMLRASANIGGLLASNTLDYSRITAPGLKANNQLLGAFDLANLSGSHTKFRASAGYALAPHAKLVSAGLQVDRDLDDRSLVRGSVSHSFDDSDTQLGFSVIRRFGPFTLAFDGDYGIGNSNYSAVLRLGFSLGRNPFTGRAFVAQSGLSGGGAALMRAFRDEDGDGQAGVGEAPLDGVTFRSGSTQAVTDKDGNALLSGLNTGTRTNLQMDVESLPDIGLYPASRGVEIVPRPGRVHVAAFAVQSLSEVEGTVYFAARARKRGVSGLALLIRDSGGSIVARVRSEADGFFLFEQLKPGRYSLALDPAQAERLRIRLEDEAWVEVGGKGGTIHRDVVVTSL